MNVTLYQVGFPPQRLSADSFAVDAESSQVIQNQELAAELLGCVPALVDVLASGRGYLLYSIFDHDGAVNPAAMTVFTAVTGIAVDASDEDSVLRGPVLVVQV